MGSRRTYARRWAAVLAVSAALLLGACGSGDRGVPLSPEAVWTPVPTEAVPALLEDETAVWDFGTVRLGERAEGLLRIGNRGSAAMTVAYPATLGAPFALDLPPGGREVASGETIDVAVTFAPVEEGEFTWEGTFGLAGEPKQFLKVKLVGTGQAPVFACDTDTLDFGKLPRGTSKELEVHCANHADVPGVLVVHPIEGSRSFTHRFGEGGGEVEVGPGEEVAIVVRFEAASDGPASGRLLLESRVQGAVERVVRVRLAGVALDRVVSCLPQTIDFGFVAPGSEARQEVVCRNEGSDPYRVEAIRLDAPSDDGFAWDAALPLELPAAVGDVPGEAAIGLVFAPDAGVEGRKNALLILETSDPGTPRLDLALTGFAGGPAITCVPGSLDFGIVAKGVPATRSFVCTNVGTDDPGRNDDLLAVEAVESTHPAEFRVEDDLALDPEGYPVGGSFTVRVTYDPQDDGSDAAAIVVRSNAVNVADGGPFEVAVSGVGRDLPPCEFEIVPEELRFGIVDKNRTVRQHVAVVNHLLDSECLIWDFRLENCHDSFTLPDGVVELEVVPPGGEVRFVVEFSPREYAEAPYTCEAHFDISNPDDRHQVVPITGHSREICALVAPTDVDFGRVEPRCATRDREFQIINLCAPTLVIDRVELAETSSEEFFLRSYPPAGATVATGNSVYFAAAYRPQDLGVDLGAIHVWVEGMDEPYAAALVGEGREGATQHDEFMQLDRPKVDVLWVIDNSGSMYWVHDQLAANLGPFLSFAEAQGIDYHIAVTTTGLAPGGSGCLGGVEGGENGRFFPVDNSRPRILTPHTPDLESTWALNVTVGTCGGVGQHEEQVFEAAYRALSPPLIDHCDDPRPTSPEPNDGNCGFLRQDAHLSIIGVTDEAEHSPQTVNFYYNAYMAIKGYRSRHLFNFHGIAGDEHVGCSHADNCDAIAEMVRKTEGGVFQSICADDWEEALRKMSANAFGFKTCFTLSAEPADKNGNGFIGDTENELLVKLNGRGLSSRGPEGQTIWSYDRLQNAICFEPLAVPEPGMAITADYEVACIQWE